MAAMTTDSLADENHQDNRLPSESSADPRPATLVVSQGLGPDPELSRTACRSVSTTSPMWKADRRCA